MTWEEEQFVFGTELVPGEVVVGPPCVLLAGVRAEEAPKVRLTLDDLGGASVRLLRVGGEHLGLTLGEAMAKLREPDWASPRPGWGGPGGADDAPSGGGGGGVAAGGGPGSPRVLLFSGLDSGERSAVVGALEARGLPRLCVASATAASLAAPLGETLARAVAADRRWARGAAALRDGTYDPSKPGGGVAADGGAGGGGGGGLDEAYDAEAEAAEEAAARADAARGMPSDDGAAGPAQANGQQTPGARRRRRRRGAPQQPAAGDPGSDPAWAAEFAAFLSEVDRRAAAGEDISFLRTEQGAAEPPDWVATVLPSDGELAKAFASPPAGPGGRNALADALQAERKDLMDFEDELEDEEGDEWEDVEDGEDGEGGEGAGDDGAAAAVAAGDEPLLDADSVDDIVRAMMAQQEQQQQRGGKGGGGAPIGPAPPTPARQQPQPQQADPWRTD